MATTSSATRKTNAAIANEIGNTPAAIKPAQKAPVNNVAGARDIVPHPCGTFMHREENALMQTVYSITSKKLSRPRRGLEGKTIEHGKDQQKYKSK
jgi:hypothetical protein